MSKGKHNIIKIKKESIIVSDDVNHHVLIRTSFTTKTTSTGSAVIVVQKDHISKSD